MKRLSLKTKSIIVMLLVAILLSTTAIISSYKVYSKTMDDHYRTNAMNIAKAAASQMDGDRIEEYVNKVKLLNPSDKYYTEKINEIKDHEYNRMLQILYDLKDSHNALYLYVQTVSAEGAVYIMDADNGDSACELGACFPLAEVNYQYLDSLENGLPAFITNTEYGWLCSAGAPIFNRQNQVVALAFVDISMDQVMADRHQFLLLVCSILILTTAISTTFILLIIIRTIVSPINTLSSTASKIISGKNKQEEKDITSYVLNSEIPTEDEIEKLMKAIKSMEEDINSYQKELALVTAEKDQLKRELSAAGQIVESLLPETFPLFPGREEIDLYAMTQPAKEGGTDFYDFYMIDQDHLAIVIGDISGRDIPVALLMLITKSLIKNQVQAGYSPAEVFANVNTQLSKYNYGFYISAWMGILQISTGKLSYVNAGHQAPLVKKKDSCYKFLKTPPGFTLAGLAETKYRQFELVLEQGDMLFHCTEGVTKAMNFKKILFGEERLLSVLNSYSNATPAELLIEVREAIADYIKEAPQPGDITMVALQIGERRKS
jgi:sigma-B regulation protein RsbU (phosphoserine phosphatase)